MGARHWVPPAVCEQAPLPLQVPVLPQGGAAVHIVAMRGGLPAGRLVQVPELPVNEQLWQPPVHAELQHLPVVAPGSFAQKGDAAAQSVSSEQVLPAGNLSPHLFVWVLQVTGALHSALLVQVLRQVADATLQANGSQFLVDGAEQAPFPSQLAGLV